MEDPKTTIKLRCLFCKSDQFVFPNEEYTPQAGDLIVCANCGRQNDYDSLLRVMKRHAKEWMEEQAQEMMQKAAKELEKAFRKLSR